MGMLNAVRGCAVPGLTGASMFWTGHSGKLGIDLSLIGTRLRIACIAALMGAAATLTFSDAADAARRRPHPSAAPALNAQAVDDAQLSAPPGKGRASADSAATIIKAEILLDRAGFSPGQIDGKSGSNEKKALAAGRKRYQTERPSRCGNLGSPDRDIQRAGADGVRNPTGRRERPFQQDDPVFRERGGAEKPQLHEPA